jgi:hypothetical protein
MIALGWTAESIRKRLVVDGTAHHSYQYLGGQEFFLFGSVHCCWSEREDLRQFTAKGAIVFYLDVKGIMQRYFIKGFIVSNANPCYLLEENA